MEKDIAKWEIASGGKNILGSGSTAPVTINSSSTDGLNTVAFAPLSNAGAIAVTYIWGNFSGLTSRRQLVEWDQIYSDSYAWSKDATGNSDKMDFENIATHELGHSMGMNDLYNSKCDLETMYGYASYGETLKRDLGQWDIVGIKTLYK